MSKVGKRVQECLVVGGEDVNVTVICDKVKWEFEKVDDGGSGGME